MQEIDGQLESERKYVERLAVEDFGTTHVGKVSHDDDEEDDDDGQAMMMMKMMMTCTSNYLVCLLQARKYLWNLTEYPETSVWARVSHPSLPPSGAFLSLTICDNVIYEWPLIKIAIIIIIKGRPSPQIWMFF